jgi:hypothetical protein
MWLLVVGVAIVVAGLFGHAHSLMGARLAPALGSLAFALAGAVPLGIWASAHFG